MMALELDIQPESADEFLEHCGTVYMSHPQHVD